MRKIWWRFLNWFARKFENPLRARVYGACPVQAEGVLPDGKFYYFRARWSAWSFGVGETPLEAIKGKLWFCRDSDYDSFPKASYISEREALKLIKKAWKEYQHWKTT